MNWEVQWEQGDSLPFKCLPKVQWCLAGRWKEIVSNMIVKSFPAVKCLFQSTSNENKVGVHRTVQDVYVLTASKMALGRTSIQDVIGSEH